MKRLAKRTLYVIAIASLALAAAACDCGGTSKPCDCTPEASFTSPSGTAPLTEFHDTKPAVEGIQYPVTLTTRCLPAGTKVTLVNSLQPTPVEGTVVIDDAVSQVGHVDFSDQTFLPGINHLCASATPAVDRNQDGSGGCSAHAVPLESCRDVLVQLGIPACRFESPTEGATLSATDDQNPAEGFQHEVRLVCKGVSDGTELRLSINGRRPLTRDLASGGALFANVDFSEGENLLHAETTGSGGETVVAEIRATVSTGGCALRLSPADGTIFRVADDEEPGVDGLQVTLAAETDAAGTFACAEGSSVILTVGTVEYNATIENHRAPVKVTFADGEFLVQAVAAEPSGGRTGRAVPNTYFVCATPLAMEITSPPAGIVITDAADRDVNEPGIQVAVRGASQGVPRAQDMELLLDGQAVLGSDQQPLRPEVFFPGADFEFHWASFLQSRAYTLQVRGRDACGQEAFSDPVIVTAQTEQRTCQIVDPAPDSVLLAAVDKDHDEQNDLQYDVRIVTANVSDGAGLTLQISGQQALAGIQVNGNAAVAETTLLDGVRTLRCVLDTGEASPAVSVTVDGHTPQVAVTSPAEGSSADTLDVELSITTSGVPDGAVAGIHVSAGTDSADFGCTVTGNGALCPVTLFWAGSGCTENTLVVSVGDILAGQPGAPGNQGTATLHLSACLATDPPVITFLDPDESASQPIAIDEASRVYTVIARVDHVAPGTPADLTIVDNGFARAPVRALVSGAGMAVFSNLPLPRGAVELRIEAHNAVGTAHKSVLLQVGDATLPIVVISAPLDGTASPQTDQTLTIHTSAGTGQTCYLCRRAHQAGGLPPVCDSAIAVGQGVVNASGDSNVAQTLVDGDYDFWASCADPAGHTGTSLYSRLVVDSAPPQAAFLEPQDGAVYNAASVDTSGAPGFQIRVRIGADVEDDQPATLLVDGAPAELVGEPPRFASNLVTFPAVTVADQAQHTLAARVCDRAGNCSDVPVVSIRVDRLIPGVAVTAPADGSVFGAMDDQSLAPGFQRNVTCTFTGAVVGDVVTLTVAGGGSILPVEHTLAASELASYTFSQATLIADTTAQPSADVVITCSLKDAADNSGSATSNVSIRTLAPQVTVSRPLNDANLNVFSDMCAPAGFQTQVNIDTINTALGDLLVVCVSPGTGLPEGACAGHGNEAWRGTVTGGTTSISCVPFEQGDNVIVGYAENIPGQGTYSDPILVHVDSIPPAVTSIVTNLNSLGCVSAAQGSLQATVSVTGAEDGRSIALKRDWPPGTTLATSTVNGGSAVFNVSLAEGEYDLTVEVRDAFNNPNVWENPLIENPEAHFMAKVDVTPPALAITQPSKTNLLYADDLNPASEDLDFVFAVSTNAEDGQTVIFAPGGAGSVTGGAASLQVSVGQGDQTLRADVADACGNPAPQATKNIFVDTVRPTISCSSPSANHTYNTQDVPFTCSTTGATGGDIRVYSSVSGLRCTVPVDGSGTTSFTCGFPEGTRDVTVNATDASGNVSADYPIPGVAVDVTGCDIEIAGFLGVEIFNLSDDKDHNAANGLQIDVTACSNTCNAANCAACTMRLTLDGVPFGSAQALDGSGCATFTNVQMADGASGITVEATIDDGVGNQNQESFQVELVDLVPPGLSRTAPGGDSVQCVASSGNPNANGTTILADKIDGAPCDMDFGFTVTGGGDATYPGTLSIKLGANTLASQSIDQASQAVSFTNVQLPDNASNALDVVASDYAGNETHLPMTVLADVTPPAVIAASATLTHSRHADVRLDWTAVGDDGASGTATSYELRWARTAITDEASWTAARPIAVNLDPQAPGQAESFTAQWLPPLNTYHLALRAVDELGNLGPVPGDVVVANNWNQATFSGTVVGFGANAWNIGDVNDDGRQDLAVSEYPYSGNIGALYVFYGNENLASWGSGGTAPTVLTRGSTGERFGWDLGCRGDLDGDGYPDLAVAGRGYNSNQGRVSIYFSRGAAGLPATADVEIRGPLPAAEFGRSVEIIGNVGCIKETTPPFNCTCSNCDDLFVSAPAANSNGVGYIFYGRSRADWLAAASGTGYIDASAADISILGNAANDWFGYRSGTGTLGDVDGDGIDDAVFIASGINQIYTYDGRVLSGASGTSLTASGNAVDTITYNIANPGTNRAGFGMRTIGGVDFTGDSVPDLLVSNAFSHLIYLFPAVDNGNPPPARKISQTYTKLISHPENINFGWDLDSADINGDGRPDFCVGTNSSGGNRAFLYLNTGTSPYFPSDPDTTLSGSGYFGYGTALGDFNGLGDIELVVTGIGSPSNGYMTVYY
ncbi:MAG: hypothetical protein GYA21_17205 [Myxococcales bacterium]|nr:hypothetical protein [Myxococcales bacterium]